MFRAENNRPASYCHILQTSFASKLVFRKSTVIPNLTMLCNVAYGSTCRAEFIELYSTVVSVFLLIIYLQLYTLYDTYNELSLLLLLFSVTE